MSKFIEKIYYDTKHPAGFSGAKNLKLELKGKVSSKDIKNWLKSQETYTLHAPVRKRFQRNYYKVSKIDDTWQADLCDMQNLALENDGFNYILTVIDIFSKFAWAVPLKDKSAQTIKDAFSKIVKESGRVPDSLMTDKGKEFVNLKMKAFYKDNNINFYTSQNPDIKASVIERFNRTLKTRMWRYFTFKNTTKYINILQNLIVAYNSTVHSSIKMAPNNVNKKNEKEVFQNLYAKKLIFDSKPKLLVGDHVRVTKEKATFAKGFERNWSREIFKVSKILRRDLVVYEIVDLADEPIEGTFYEIELQKVFLSDTHKIDKIIRSKGKGDSQQLFVKWTGYPDKFNSWVLASDLQI